MEKVPNKILNLGEKQAEEALIWCGKTLETICTLR
jgi:hypothetical protein